MIKSLLLLLVCLSSLLPLEAQDANKEIPGNDFNSYVVALFESYPTDGTHGYYWPSGSSWAGNTQDLDYRGDIFAKGDPYKRCYCCGLTFEVFFLAYKKYCEDQSWDFIIAGLDAKGLLKLRQQWFGADGNRKTMQNAILQHKLGFVVPMNQAKKGDFVQLWRNNGSGHSVIFIAWVYSTTGEIRGMKYWSTQGSTNGIGYRTEYFGGSSGMDAEQLYITRVGK